MKAKISILMGIYNCASTLDEAVESIKKQTYQNWELILCDDGSTDNTYDVAQKLEQSDYRIILIRNEKNKGLASTLNHCLQYATGEYIARMDGDDRCDAERFEKELDFLIKHPEYDFVSTGMEFYDENGVYGRLFYRAKPEGKHFIKGSEFCHASCMIRTKTLNAVGGYDVSKEVERVEDFNLWLRLYEKGYKGYNLQEILYSMRDDRNAYARRKMKYRINESKIMWRAGKIYGEKWFYKYYAIRPIILGCTPMFIYKILHKKRLGR